MKFLNFFNPPRAGAIPLTLNSASPDAILSHYVVTLGASKSALESQIAALPDVLDESAAESLLKTAVVVSVYLEQALPRHKQRLANLETLREERAKDVRNLQWRAGMDRLPRRPNVLKTLLLVQGFVLAETLLMAAMLIEGGHISVVGGVGYGFVFSAVNSVLALWTGFSFVRMAAHRKASPAPQRSDAFVRLMGKLGIAGFGGLLAVLIFAASRIRATGSHIPFDFSHVGLWEGLNNGVSLAILATALLASAVNLWKGATGFTDFQIGASEALANATDKITQSARKATGQAIHSVLSRVEPFLSDARGFLGKVEKDAKAQSAQLLTIRDAIRAHNSELAAAKQAVLAAHAREHDHRAKVLNTPLPEHAAPDLGALDALALPLMDEQAIGSQDAVGEKLEELRAVISEVTAARDALISDLDTAQAEFEAASIGISAFPDANKKGA